MNMKAIGIWDFEIYNLDDELQKHFTVKNQITNLGAELYAKVMTQGAPILRARGNDNDQPVTSRYGWDMVFGTSNAAVSENNIALGAPVLDKYSSDTYSSLSRSGKTFTYSVRVDTDEGNGNTLREAGIYDRMTTSTQKSTGAFMNRVLISPAIVKTSSNWFTATATITFT